MNEFIRIIEELILLFHELAPVEQRKLDSITQHRVTFLEECMKEEQAALLKLRGLDKRREASQKALGWGGLTFQEILSNASPDEQQVLSPLFTELSSSLGLFTDIRDSSRSLLEINLHKIDLILAEQGASQAVDGGHLTSKKI